MLLKCIEQDATLRSIADMSVVLSTLRDRQERLERIVLAELLERGCCPQRLAMKHKHIMAGSAKTMPEKLIEKESYIHHDYCIMFGVWATSSSVWQQPC